MTQFHCFIVISFAAVSILEDHDDDDDLLFFCAVDQRFGDILYQV